MWYVTPVAACAQVEGYTTADGRGPSIWDTFSAKAGKTFNGETGVAFTCSCMLRPLPLPDTIASSSSLFYGVGTLHQEKDATSYNINHCLLLDHLRPSAACQKGHAIWARVQARAV